MDRLFRMRPKAPADIVRQANEALAHLAKVDKSSDKRQDEIARHLQSMKAILHGTGEQEPQTEQVAALAQEIYNANLLVHLIDQLDKLDFESKKDVALIFSNLLRRQIGTRSPTVDYVAARPEILSKLVRGHTDVALNCGSMLRECVRHEPLARMVLHSEDFWQFFVFVEMDPFDVASDAFSTFKELITRHKTMCAEYLNNNYDMFFGKYEALLKSENYVTRRQSLKLLGGLLLERHNFDVMTRYISNTDNLKLMMNMLREKSKSIQYEAFHVFKVFVANPKKTRPIAEILLRNRDKLIEFLTKFHTDRTGDEQFNDEKAYLIKQIQEMQPLPPVEDS